MSDEFKYSELFTQNDDDKRLLEQIAADLRVDKGKPLFIFTPKEADSDQRRFIESTAPVIRLIAPAGSGKTQSIVNRVLRRIGQGESLSQFLILTFDNSAGQSLADKFRSGLASVSVSESPQVMTLNRFGFGLFPTVLGSRGNLRVGGNVKSDQREAVRRSLNEFKVARPDIWNLLPSKLGYRVYHELFSMFKNNLFLPDTIFTSGKDAYVNWCKGNRLLAPWLKDTPHDSLDGLKIVNALANLYRHYCQLMLNHNRIDFDDQKLLPYLSLSANESLANSVTSQYRCIIVDEFQDINLLDFEFIRLIAKNKELIVVGDDDQAIYAFRGCSPDYILRFPERIERPVESHLLNVNYRCPKNIVSMSSQLIQHNSDRITKNPRAASSRDADVKLWHCLNSASEAQILARTIKRIYTELSPIGLQYSDIAMLFRMNSQSLPLQIALIREEIPYHCRKEDNVIVSDTMERLLALIALHLKIIEDPSHFSHLDTALLCDCYFQYPKDAKSILQKQVERTKCYIRAAQAAAVQSGQHKFTPNFAAAVASLFEKDMSPARLVKVIGSNFKSLGGIVGTLEDALNDTLPLGELVDIAGRFQGDVRQFLDALNGLVAKVQGGIYHAEEGDAVNLLTYFKAKGRQWHTVIIPGCNQKVVPHSRSRVEDERRLFYVALTRATHHLILSYVRQAVGSAVEPSQFLKEMNLGDGDEKRSTFIAIGTTSTPPASRHQHSRTAPPRPPTKSSKASNPAYDQLIEILDVTVFPAMAGMPPRSSRLARMTKWRETLATCPIDTEEIYEAIIKCDSAIRSNEHPKIKIAILTWSQSQKSK